MFQKLKLFSVSVLVFGFVQAHAATVVTVTAGDRHSCVLTDEQKVKCWGDNNNGQLGLGDNVDRGSTMGQMGNNLPYVNLGTDVKAKYLGSGTAHTCILSTTNQVKCWGGFQGGVLGQGDNVDIGDQSNEMGDNLPFIDFGEGLKPQKLFVGIFHNCALFDGGRIKCWGYNDFGQLGLGDLNNRGESEGEMGDNLPFVDLGKSEKVLKVSTGYEHSCALLEGGKIKCWGRSATGQTGYGIVSNIGDQANEMGDLLPYVDLGENFYAVDIIVGNNHSCALANTGLMKCWGTNTQGQLGLGDTNNRGDVTGEMGDKLSFTNVSDLPLVSIYPGGRSHACAKLLNNTVKCWGSNGEGQLGLDDSDDRGDQNGEMGDLLSPLYLGKNTSVESLSLGGNHTCGVISRLGQYMGVKCWGSNDNGQLGYGDVRDRGNSSGDMQSLGFIDLGI